MKLLTKEIEAKLIENFNVNNAKPEDTEDFRPVVKFFGGGSCTWLITEYNKEEEMFFGLCDLGMGYPEIGYVSRIELEAARFQFGLGVERDRHFTAQKTLSEYAEDARQKDRIEA